jgi:hypothetical protein
MQLLVCWRCALSACGADVALFRGVGCVMRHSATQVRSIGPPVHVEHAIYIFWCESAPRRGGDPGAGASKVNHASTAGSTGMPRVGRKVETLMNISNMLTPLL